MASFSTSCAETNTLKVALCQFLVGADKPTNIARAISSIDEAATGGAQLVVLPEIWNSPYSTSSFRQYAEPVPEPGTGQ
jgi:omega-amidase